MKTIAVCLCAGILSSTLLQHVSPLEAATETVVYSFRGGVDGAWPDGGLIDVNGTLYGAAVGNTTCGTLYSIDPKSGKETVLHSFAGGTDGCGPSDSLINVHGMLYGETISGGTGTCGLNSCGTVYAFDPTTGTETVLHSFAGGSDGQLPQGGLVAMNGILYGTTFVGGTYGGGTVFSVDPATGAETVVYSFCESQCTSGFWPVAPLIGVKGTLYGTTTVGGQSPALGTVFSLDPATGIEAVVYSFCSKSDCADGASPYSGLLKLYGNLYGTTEQGGGGCTRKAGCGAVFSIDPATGAEAVLHGFAGRADGKYPQAGLLSINGTLFGTTTGGNHHVGTVFSIDPTTGAATALYDFQGSPDGALPHAGLVNVNGTLYGTTIYGGTGTCKFNKQAVGCGTVFSITP